MDLSRSFEEAKSLPDQYLQRALNDPSIGIPGYIALAELRERQVVRQSAGGNANYTLAQKYGSKGYSEGGLIIATNPFHAFINALQNPETTGGIVQEAINYRYNNQPPLMPTQAPQAPQSPYSLGIMSPRPAGNLVSPNAVGGVDLLARRG